MGQSFAITCIHPLWLVYKTHCRLLYWNAYQILLYVLTFIESNFLIRKQCEHKDEFDCGCSNVVFDVVLTDYDYVHEEGSEINDPTHTGTLQYRALPLRVCILCTHYTYHKLFIVCVQILLEWSLLSFQNFISDSEIFLDCNFLPSDIFSP